MRTPPWLVAPFVVFAIALLPRDVAATGSSSGASGGASIDPPNGIRMLKWMGPNAERALAPATGKIGALVQLPAGVTAESLGLKSIAPGIGRLRASAAAVTAFAAAHPGLHVEVAPPLHTTLTVAGQWTHAIAASAKGADGTGALVGVADTGVDVTHPDLRNADGSTRVAWLLDYSLAPLGVYPALESEFGITDDTGNIVAGAVLSSTEINQLITQKGVTPSDEIGHGTHVTSIAASNGLAPGKYAGVAPKADILFVRVTHANSDAIENDDLVNAVKFMFGRADFMQKPVAVNLSLGSDFGSHDGNMLWEQTIASFVGADFPGHALVAAAGNSGSVADLPIHQVVHVSSSSTTLVPITTEGASVSGTVQVWVSLRSGANVKVGLDGPDGEWIAPVGNGDENGKNTSDYNAGIIFGQSDPTTPVPVGSNGAVIVWTGKWPSGVYNVKLQGDGTVDLYLQGLGDADPSSPTPAGFSVGVREGTINLPATNPGIIGVGCTVNRTKWTSIAGATVGVSVPILDSAGGLPDSSGDSTDLGQGDICWFSSAGPNALGVAKPEIAAPGGVVVAAMSKDAPPSSTDSIFNSGGDCPTLPNGQTDDRCLQIDDMHAVSVGTSMSAPMVAGAAAILFQQDPTLTQPQVMALLQAGAHRIRGQARFDDQSGPGELDILGSLEALERMKNPLNSLPAIGASWLTLSEDFVPADGSTPLTVIAELRTATGDLADFIDVSRISPVVIFNGIEQTPPTPTRRGPGVWVYIVTPPAGFGGTFATFGLQLDGVDVVNPKTIPVATDPWNASYPSQAAGACSVHAVGAHENEPWNAPFDVGAAGIAGMIGLAASVRRRSRARRA